MTKLVPQGHSKVKQRDRQPTVARAKENLSFSLKTSKDFDVFNKTCELFDYGRMSFFRSLHHTG